MCSSVVFCSAVELAVHTVMQHYSIIPDLWFCMPKQRASGDACVSFHSCGLALYPPISVQSHFTGEKRALLHAAAQLLLSLYPLSGEFKETCTWISWSTFAATNSKGYFCPSLTFFPPCKLIFCIYWFWWRFKTVFETCFSAVWQLRLLIFFCQQEWHCDSLAFCSFWAEFIRKEWSDAHVYITLISDYWGRESWRGVSCWADMRAERSLIKQQAKTARGENICCGR